MKYKILSIALVCLAVTGCSTGGSKVSNPAYGYSHNYDFAYSPEKEVHAHHGIVEDSFYMPASYFKNVVSGTVLSTELSNEIQVMRNKNRSVTNKFAHPVNGSELVGAGKVCPKHKAKTGEDKNCECKDHRHKHGHKHKHKHKHDVQLVGLAGHNKDVPALITHRPLEGTVQVLAIRLPGNDVVYSVQENNNSFAKGQNVKLVGTGLSLRVVEKE